MPSKIELTPPTRAAEAPALPVASPERAGRKIELGNPVTQIQTPTIDRITSDIGTRRGLFADPVDNMPTAAPAAPAPPPAAGGTAAPATPAQGGTRDTSAGGGDPVANMPVAGYSFRPGIDTPPSLGQLPLAAIPPAPAAANTGEPRSIEAVHPFDAQSGVDRNLVNPLRTGVQNLRQAAGAGASNVTAERLQFLDQIDELESNGRRADALDLAGRLNDLEISQYARTRDPAQRDAVRQRLQSALTFNVSEIVASNEELGTIPRNPRLQAALESGDLGQFAGAIVEDPAILLQLTLESAPLMAPGIAMAPVAGPAIGFGSGSLFVENGLSLVDSLGEAGVDVRDPAALRAAFDDPDILAQAREFAIRKGAPVALFDALSGGIAGRMMVPGRVAGRQLSQPARELANIPAQMPVQGALGAGGEAAGQLLSSGEINAAEVAAEAVAEVGGAVAEVPAAAAASGRLIEDARQQQQAEAQRDLESVLDDDRPLDEIRREQAEQAPPPEPDGTRTRPIIAETIEDVDRAAEQVVEPTPAQAEAGNYRAAYVRVQDLPIKIETPRGGTRSGIGADGQPWSVVMPAHYGEVQRTEGADGDAVDVYVGPQIDVDTVFVVDQIDPATGQFDEHKVMIGYPDPDSALADYRAAFNDGSGDARIGEVTPWTMAQFKQWLRTDDTGPIRYDEAMGFVTRTNDQMPEGYGIGRAPSGEFALFTPDGEVLVRSQTMVNGEPRPPAFRMLQQWLRRATQHFADNPAPIADETGPIADQTVGISDDSPQIVPDPVPEPQQPAPSPAEDIPEVVPPAAEPPAAAVPEPPASEPHGAEPQGPAIEQPPTAPAEAPRAGTVDEPDVPVLGQIFADHLARGGQFANIQQARQLAARELGGSVAPGTAAAKAVDEATELGVVVTARGIVDAGNDQGQTYDALVDLYQRQPSLSTRTSTSVRNQAFSTPVPIAYVAAVRAGITPSTMVYEPTAGNGALLITAHPNNVIANEIDEVRRANLDSQGFAARGDDATELFLPRRADVVIANPPFGTLEGRTWKINDRYTTNQIDHAITFTSLEAMKDDGRAVLIVAGVNKQARSEDARSDAYNSKDKREFYLSLYDQYNVVDHFTASGELYSRQGAGWPVDVIVIEGRGKSSRLVPAADVPRVYRTFDALKEALNAPAISEREQPQGLGADEGRGVGEPAGDTGASRDDQPVDGPVSEPPRATRPGDDRGNAGSGARDDDADTGVPEQRPRRGGQEGKQPRTDDRPDRGEPVIPRPAEKAERPADEPNVEGRAEPGRAAHREEGEPPGLDRPRDVPAEGRRGLAEDTAPVQRPAEGARQVTYKPRSGSGAMGTLVPVNMQTSTRDALKKLSDRVGEIDQYVARELGYKPDELSRHFAAEQIDAIALALKNFDEGSGFIIGDQTGIGKGRVVAAVIRWAIRKGKVPIFVTEKPNLYADMMRDLGDVGVTEVTPDTVIMTNADIKVPLEGGAGMLTSPGAAQQTRRLNAMRRGDGDLGAHNVIFTTYNQMQTIKGARTPRMEFLDQFAAGAVVIFDESHNAGGAKEQGAIIEDKNLDRAKFARQLVEKASAVMYSSATYAKRPEVMDLYSKTDMRLAVPKIDALAEAISRGGIPMQQVVASMLSESGQYIRRERSFDGVTYDAPVVDVKRSTYSAFSSLLKRIQVFSEEHVKKAVKGIDKEAKAEGKQVSGDGSTGGAGATSTNFSSIMHNLIDQMLLAMKVEPAVEAAIAALKKDEKPVITVSNTMGSFIEDYVGQAGIGPGDAINLGFNDLLLRYLERSREILVRQPFMSRGSSADRVYLTDEKLGPAGVAYFDEVKKAIKQADLAELPVSPIDMIHSRLREAGYKTGEITGRAHTIEYRGGAGIYRVRRARETSIAGRRGAIEGFNSGKLDALVLNQAGSTGLSLHASEAFSDKRRRHMVIAQAEKNIDTHMQMLGRVHRTGQVITPTYTQLVANVPAEKRPAAVLAKKMASLNANTTASRGGALTAEDVPDFLNQYGDYVAASVMQDNPDLHGALGRPLPADGEGLKTDEAMRKVTGRIPLLPIADQETLYDMLEGEYSALIEQLNEAGENVLEAQTLDLDARRLESSEVVAAQGVKDSPFAGAVTAEISDVKKLSRPLKSDQVIDMVAEFAEEQPGDGDTAAKLDSLMMPGTVATAKIADQARADFRAYRRNFLDEITNDQTRAAQTKRLDAILARFNGVLDVAAVGRSVRVKAESGNIYGVVTRVHRTGKAKNPLAMGAWKVTIATVNGARTQTYPMSQLYTAGNAPSDQSGALVNIIERAGKIADVPVIEAFDKISTKPRETRTIMTGNLLAAFDYVKGKGSIVNFTDKSGRIRQGIMMARDFNLEKFEEAKPVPFSDVGQMVEFMGQGGALRSEDGAVDVTMIHNGRTLSIRVARAKARGGRYYLDFGVLQAVGGDFVSSGDAMVATVDSESAGAALRALKKAGAEFQASKDQGLARKVTGQELPTPKKADDGETSALTSAVRPGPRRGRNVRGPDPVPSEPKTDPAMPARIRDLINQLRETFSVTAVRQGRIRTRNAEGTYNSKTGVIRQKQTEDIEVFAHEAGHHIERHYGTPLQDLITLHKDELTPLDYEPNRKNRRQALREGFAEWFSIYTLNKEWVHREAPQFTKAFEAFLKKTDPEAASALNEIMDAYQQFLRAPSAAVIKADVVSTDVGNIFRRMGRFLTGQRKMDAISALARQVYTNRLDRLHPINVAVQRLLRLHERNSNGRLDLKLADNPYVLARLQSDAYGAGHIDITEGVADFETGDPAGPSLAAAINKALGKAKWSEDVIAEFGAYLVSRRAVHEWDRYFEGKMPRPPSKFSQADHRQNITEMERKHPDYADAAKMVYEWTNALWEKKRDAGLITEEAYQEGLKEHPDYVPFLRDRQDIEDGQVATARNSAQGTGKRRQVFHMEGSLRSVLNPLETLMRDAYMTNQVIAGNETRKKLWDLAKKAGRDSGAIVEKIPNNQVRAVTVSAQEVADAIAKQAGVVADISGERDKALMDSVLTMFDSLEIESLRFFKPGEINEKGEPIVYVWVGGKRQALRLADGDYGRELYAAITGMDRETSGTFINLAAAPAAAIRIGVTAEPSFQLANIIRGEVASWILVPKYTPGIDLLRGAKSAFTSDAAQKRYVAAGGLMGGVNVAALHKKRAMRDLRDLKQRRFPIRRVTTARGFMELIEISESSNRLGIFKRQFEEARRRGLSDKEAAIEAAYLARDYIDYGRHGSKMLFARRLVTFINAALQGLDKTVRVLGGQGNLRAALRAFAKRDAGHELTPTEKRELRHSARAWAQVTLLGMVGIVIAHMYRDDEEYQEISEYIRATHWVVKAPAVGWVAIPKPFELAFLSNIFERGYEAVYHDDPTAWDKMATGLGTLVLPPWEPAFMTAPIEHWANKSLWNGRPIIPDYLLGKPVEQQYTNYTSSFARWFGGQFNWSPILVDHYITSYGGTLARSALSLTSEADPNAPAQGLDDMVFFRRFFRDWTRGAVSRQRYYEEADDTTGRLVASYRAFRDAMDEDRTDEALAYGDKLDLDQRVYAVWRWATRNRRIGEVTGRRLHPIERARDATRALFGVRTDMRNLEELSADEKRLLDDLLGQRVVMEYRNALIVIGARGYENRDPMDLSANLAEIREISPDVGRMIADRSARIPPAQDVYDFYPDLRRTALETYDDLKSRPPPDKESDDAQPDRP